MLSLIPIIHIFVGSTIAGSFIIAALVMGYDTAQPLVLTALVGFGLSFPVSWWLALRLSCLS